MRGPLLTMAAALSVVLVVVAALLPPATATATANEFPEEDKNLGLRLRPAVGDPVVGPFSPASHSGGRPDRDEGRRSKLRSSGSGAFGAGHSGSRLGVPRPGVPRFRGAVPRQETKAEPKEANGPTTYPFTQPFTPSRPVSFSSFSSSFVPSPPPPGTETHLRGGHSEPSSTPPGRQAPRHPTSPFPRPVRIRAHGPGSHYEDEKEEYPPAYEGEGPVGYRGHFELEDEKKKYPPTYEKERPLGIRGRYEDDEEKEKYLPTYEQEQPVRNRGHYEENGEEEYAPTYEENRQFPEYEDDYESFEHEGGRHEFAFDNQDYDGPPHDGGGYQGSPVFREQYSAPRDERQRYRPPPGFRNQHLHHNHHPPTSSSDAHRHHYPPSPPPPRYKGQDEEREEGGGGGEPCKTVQKNGMTCEVCRDDEGGFSEHCSHSSRNSHDEAFSSNRRQHKRDAATSAPRQTRPSRASAQTSSNQSQDAKSRVDVAKKRSKATSRATITTAAPGNLSRKGPSRPSPGRNGGARAQERQDMEFSFHLDDLDDYGLGDDLHDLAFHDNPSQRHHDHDHHYDFDLDLNHHQHQQPEFYQMSAHQYSALPQPHATLRDTHARLLDTHARLEEAMDQFMTKDRSSCKKVEKRGMTCYLCPRGKGAAEEECMYASRQPDGHDLHYSEESTYGSSSSSSSSSPSPYSSSPASSFSGLRSADKAKMSHDGDDMFGLMPDAESEVVSLAMGFSSDSPISNSDATALNANTWSSSYNLTAVNESLFLEDLRDAGGGYFRRRKFNLSLIDLERLFPSMEAVSDDVQVFLVAVYSLAAALSLLGNVTVILVLAFGKRSSVRCYLINLAVSDITMAAFCIPFSYTSFMFHRWIFAPEFCRVVAFMQHVSVTCSVYTLVAIGVDRHKALIHPLNTRWTKSRSRLVIGGIWVFSVLISLVPLVVSDTERFDWGGEWYYECKEQWPRTENEVYEKTYTVLLFVLTFALPVSGLGYTYLSIVAMMCTYRMPGNAEPSRDQHHLHAKIKMINMMIAVMVCFVLSWLPLQVLQFLIYFEPDITRCRGRQCYPYYMSFFACHWIAMANSFMNPFIYCFMSKNFREDFLQFLRKCGCRREPRRRSPPWSHSDLGSSFRSILNITHKTSVQSPSRAAAVGMRARQDGQRVEVEDTELKLLQPPYGSLRDTRGSAKWRVVRRSNSSSGGGGGGGRGGSGKAVLALQAPASAAFTSTNMQDSYRKRSQEHHHNHHHRDQLSQQNNHNNHHHHHHHHQHHQQHRLPHSPQQHHHYHHHHQASLSHNSSPFLNASPPIGLPRSPVNSCFTEVNLMKET